MCGKRSQHHSYHEHYGHSTHFGFWPMPFIPFLVVMFFVFAPHSWTFASHVWSWLWVLFPIVMVVCITALTKVFRIGYIGRCNARSQEELPLTQAERDHSQTYQQVYYPVQETYQEGGQQFQYSHSETQFQQSQYEQPYAQYPREMPPSE